jgi:hypothetical protein
MFLLERAASPPPHPTKECKDPLLRLIAPDERRTGTVYRAGSSFVE